MIQKIFTINRLADTTCICIDVCVHAPEKKDGSKTWTTNPRKWHPNRFVSRGWLRNSSPRGVAAAATLAIIYIDTLHIHTHNPDLFPPLLYSASFYPILNDQNVLFRTRSCTIDLKIFTRFFFFLFDYKTRNPPSYKIVQLYITAANASVSG